MSGRVPKIKSASRLDPQVVRGNALAWIVSNALYWAAVRNATREGGPYRRALRSR
jgi:hypothetical protein